MFWYFGETTNKASQVLLNSPLTLNNNENEN